jgi:hypothetical protein
MKYLYVKITNMVMGNVAVSGSLQVEEMYTNRNY